MVMLSEKLAEDVFAGGGEMGARMRSLDWSKTSLGPVDAWPQSLKTSVSICLNSRFAILIWWGPELVKLYNDAYVPLLGSKHPRALGDQGREVWPEIWDTIGPMLSAVMERGEASWSDDLQLFLERHGYAEECYFTFSYSPIRDESGGVGGVFTPVLETTDRVIDERRLRTLRDVAAVGGKKSTSSGAACVAVAQALSSNPYDLPFAAIYLFDHERQHANLMTGFTGNAEGLRGRQFPKRIDFHDESWLPYARIESGEICPIDLCSQIPFALPEAPWGTVPVQAIAVPIAHNTVAEPVGFLLAGVSARKRLDDRYRQFYAQIAVGLAGAIRETETLGRESDLQAQAEAERAKLRDTFMNAPAAIAILNGLDHTFDLVNQKYVRLVGRKSASDLIGKPLLEVLPELDGQGIVELLDEVYSTGVPFVGSERLIHVDRTATGQPVDGYFNFVYQPAFDTEGQVEGILVLAIDVTEQVVSRQEVEMRERQFRALADSIPQMAWMANADGYVFWYNRRWYEYTGTTLEQMEGWGWQAVHAPESLPIVMTRYKQTLEAGEPFDMTFPLRGADGEYRSFLTRALPVRDNTGKIVRWFGTNTDVESQQKAEIALRQSEKLAAVGRLASSIAHEINNPLEAVINLIYLARATAINEDVKVYLDSAEQELARVSQITNQTLRFHKQQTMAEPTDLTELFDSVLTLYRGKLSRDGIQLRMEISNCPPLVCYAGEIRQVIANLLGNALDAMPKGGILRLRVRPGIDWRDGQPSIRLTIADTGHGMPAEIRKRIYEPFFTTKGETGTGLGLWVSASIVENHGGSMQVRSCSRPGASWTVFAAVFPHGGVVRESVRQSHTA